MLQLIATYINQHPQTNGKKTSASLLAYSTFIENPLSRTTAIFDLTAALISTP